MLRPKLANNSHQVFRRLILDTLKELDLSKLKRNQGIIRIQLRLPIVFKLILAANQDTLFQTKCQLYYSHGRTSIAKAKAEPLEFWPLE